MKVFMMLMRGPMIRVSSLGDLEKQFTLSWMENEPEHNDIIYRMESVFNLIDNNWVLVEL